MPLTLSAMTAVQLVCVVAAGAMVLQSRTRRTRAMHLVMLGVMVALTVAGGLVALAASVAVLAAAGGWLLAGPRRAQDASCSLDLLACAGLVALMGVASARHDGAHQMAGHAMHHAAGVDTRTLVAACLAALVVACWAVLRRHVRGDEGWRAALPAWAMVLGMSAMVAL